MKIMMLCGSSSPKNSTSLYLLEELKKKLSDQEVSVFEIANRTAKEAAIQLAEAINDCDALVIAYSLYVDAVPSHLLETLREIEKQSSNIGHAVRVYQIINNGFYEATQNRLAIDMVWKWCEKCHFERGCAIGVGAGSMARVAPLGYGPLTSLGKTMDRLADIMIQKQSYDTIFVEPNYPRFLYRLQFDHVWMPMAKQNGLKRSDLNRRQVLTRLPE